MLKSKAQVSSLRAKWALATNSQMGLLDEVRLEEVQGGQGGAPTLASLGEPIPHTAPAGSKKTKKQSRGGGPGAKARPNTTAPEAFDGGGGGGGGLRPASSMPSFTGAPSAGAPAPEPWEDAGKLQQLMGGRR